MKKLLLIAALMMVAAPSAKADYVQKLATTLRYNASQPPVGWHAVSPSDFGFTDVVFIWPATKGVSMKLGKLSKGSDHTCRLDYESDIAIASTYGVYFATYKVDCD